MTIADIVLLHLYAGVVAKLDALAAAKLAAAAELEGGTGGDGTGESSASGASPSAVATHPPTPPS
jgi:hypothetical protein